MSSDVLIYEDMSAEMHLLDMMFADAHVFVEVERASEKAKAAALATEASASGVFTAKEKRTGPLQILLDGLQALQQKIGQSKNFMYAWLKRSSKCCFPVPSGHAGIPSRSYARQRDHPTVYGPPAI